MSRRWDLRAEEFHRRNPEVMRRLDQLAIAAVNAGRRRLSINELFEVVRYEHGLRHGDQFRMNNNYRAWYSRQLMARNPRLDGLFQLRGDNDAEEPRDVSPGAMLDVAVDRLVGTAYGDEDGEDWS